MGGGGGRPHTLAKSKLGVVTEVILVVVTIKKVMMGKA